MGSGTMQLPELLIVFSFLIIVFGIHRAFRHPRVSGGSAKPALFLWALLLVAGVIIWGWTVYSPS